MNWRKLRSPEEDQSRWCNQEPQHYTIKFSLKSHSRWDKIMTNAVWFILNHHMNKCNMKTYSIRDLLFPIVFTCQSMIIAGATEEGHATQHQASGQPWLGCKWHCQEGCWVDQVVPGVEKEYEHGSWSKECQNDAQCTFMIIHLFATSKAFNLSWVTSWAARLCAPYAPRPKIVVCIKNMENYFGG